MKFCDISSFYSPLGGGVRTYHDRKIAFFNKHPEHEYVLVIAGRDNGIKAEGRCRVYSARGFPVTRDGAYRQIFDAVEVRRILQRERPDVIEVGSPYLDCWLAPPSKRASSAVVSGLYHADVPGTYVAPALHACPLPLAKPIISLSEWYVARAYGRFDVTLAASRHAEQQLRRYGLTNTCCLPLGVDTALFHPNRRDQRVRASLGVGPEETLLLFAGRFRAEKDIETLLCALRELSTRRGLKIALAGRGPLADLVRQTARQHAGISCLGFIDDPLRIAVLFASADIYLAPGRHETFGLAALEALSSGVPVAAAGSGGNAELVEDSEAGALFAPGSARDLIRAVEEIRKADRPALGRRARAFVEGRFSWDRTFEAMVTKYRELQDAKGIRRHFAA